MEVIVDTTVEKQLLDLCHHYGMKLLRGESKRNDNVIIDTRRRKTISGAAVHERRSIMKRLT